MFTLTTNLPSESWCASVLRRVRWGREDSSGKAICPRCGSSKTKKDGYYGCYQKYFCKSCGRSFNDKTGTLFHYSHTPLNRWFLAIYLFFVLWLGCSIRETSQEAVIPYYRCYRFIRTIMERLLFLSSSILRHTKLKGKVESDEFYLKAGLKGRSYYHEQITNSGRAPRRRALKPWKGRGTFEKEQPMIMCLHQRKKRRRESITRFHVPTQKKGPITHTLLNNVKRGSMLYTDDYEAYARFPTQMYKHRFVNHSKREYVRGDVHTNNCECRINLFKLWIRKFMGVNKYNLLAYSKTFEHILSNRMTAKTREERFLRVLSLVRKGGRNILRIRAKQFFTALL